MSSILRIKSFNVDTLLVTYIKFFVGFSFIMVFISSVFPVPVLLLIKLMK